MSSDKPLAKNNNPFVDNKTKSIDNNNRFLVKTLNNCFNNQSINTTNESTKQLVSNCHQINRQSIGVKEFNELISCYLCKGYLIDATTVIECLHSFCKTCVINHLESNTPKSRFCPKCDNQIHKTKPKLNIRSDPTLQDIVYKLVPGLYKNEMNRRKEFYSKEPESAVGLSNEEKGEMSGERLIFTPEDSICLSIEYFPQYVSHSMMPFDKKLSNGALNSEPAPNETANGTDDDSQRRYLKCPGGMRVEHLKKWLKSKYNVKDINDIEILYKHDPLYDDYTMIDLAYIYSWRRNGPLCLYYKFIAPQKLAKEDGRQLRATTVVAKRKHKFKHKNNNKKRKLIDESNLITTNPVNEPLAPVDSALIHKVVASNTIGANLELMTTAVNNALIKSRKTAKKVVNNKKSPKVKSQSVKSVPKKADLSAGGTGSKGAVTTGANKAKAVDKINANISETNGLTNNKSIINNSITNSINNGLKKSINKQINGVFGAVTNSPSIEAINKLVNNNQKINSNSSQTNTNSSNDQNSGKSVDNKTKTSIVPQIETNVKSKTNSEQKITKTNNSNINNNNQNKSTANGVTNTDSAPTVQPFNTSKPTNASPKSIAPKAQPNNGPEVNKTVKSKAKTNLISNKAMNYITNSKISITPVPKPQNNNKSPTVKSIVDQNRIQNTNNGFKAAEKALKLIQSAQPLVKSPLMSPIPPLQAFMSSMMTYSAPDIFQFNNFALNSSKCLPKPMNSKTIVNNDHKNSDNNCNDSEVALNLSTSKDKTT